MIVNTRVPFVRGGAEALEKGLIKALKDAGHQVDTIRILDNWSSHEYILKMILEARLLDVETLPLPPDRVIAIKFPSYYIKHNNKCVWFLHHYRQFYDLWDSPYSPTKEEDLLALREIIIKSDTSMLQEARVFAQSKTVSKRLKMFNGIESEVLYPPLENKDIFKCTGYENFVFFPSRLSAIKRHELAINAMRYTKTPIKLLIAGRVEDINYYEKIRRIIDEKNLSSKIELLTNITQEELVDFYSKCLSVLFPTYNEDYGYITLEAMYSHKAVITCTDSGGPIEFIENSINGFIVEPDPEVIADCLDFIYSNKETAIRMGRSGYEKVITLNISWEKVVEKLCS